MSKNPSDPAPTMRFSVLRITLGSLLFFIVSTSLCLGQQPAKVANQDDKSKTDTKKIEIKDEPKFIDPSQFVHQALAKKTTVKFERTSIREVIKWIEKETKMTVLVDDISFAKATIHLNDQISENLDDEPIYLLLDRLKLQKINWYMENDIVHLTSKEFLELPVKTMTINIGKFFDQGFEEDRLVEAIQNTSTSNWLDTDGGPATLVILGDVAFIQQTDRYNRRIRGLLAALENHGRQTFVDDAEQHLSIRNKLKDKLNVDFEDVPFADAITKLESETGLAIRFDKVALAERNFRERQPISLRINQPISIVLDAVCAKFDFSWTVWDGSILITTIENEYDKTKIAVYDVRDLCRDFQESTSLLDALTIQIDPESWLETNGGPGTVSFPKPGMLVINQTESIHQKVLQKLEAYRLAIKSSKFRERPDPMQEVSTVFYKVPREMAVQLDELIKDRIAPDTWKKAKANNNEKEEDKAVGSIRVVASRPSALEKDKSIIIENSVLIIEQTEQNHIEIAHLIRNVENGSAFKGAAGGGGLGGLGGGSGGGGFGGGLFSIPPSPKAK